MLYTLLPPTWLRDADASVRDMQLDCSLEEALEWNACGFNLYDFPNGISPERLATLPKNPHTGQPRFLQAKDIDQFDWVFADWDAKHETYPSKDAFIERVLSEKVLPTRLVDSGNGIHAYYRVSDLDAKSYLRLQRRIARYLKTDPAVAMLKQLLRVPGSLNQKDPANPKPCVLLYEDLTMVYDSEALDEWLPPITAEDEEFINRHYDSSYELNQDRTNISTELPPRFLKLCREDPEINHLYFGQHKDRSIVDFRLGLQLFNHGFARDEAMSVLSRTAKAVERTRHHQIGYAENIVSKVWDAAEKEVKEEQAKLKQGKYPFRSAADIEKGEHQVVGESFPCSDIVDATADGFRRKQVLGLIGGSGGGKSTFALNLFRWFVETNTNRDYIHLFVTLEMEESQVVARWNKMSEELKRERPKVNWNSLVYVLGNYGDHGEYRELGLDDIRDYAQALQTATGKKIGCLVIDHIGVLKQKRGTKDGEMDGLMGVCKGMKSLAVALDVFLVMQSQTSRAKAGLGDLPLGLDAAWGTSFFEHYCDFVVTIHQPLKRVVSRMPPESKLSVMAFKFCKIRERDIVKDRVQLDETYGLSFDPATELLHPLTSDEEGRYEFWNTQANTLRKRDRHEGLNELRSITWTATKREKPAKEAAS